MKLATFTHGGATRIGVVVGEEVVDLAAAAPSLPAEMPAFLAAGAPALDATRKAVAGRGPRIKLAAVHLEAPVRCPPKFLALGLNYAAHVAESGRPRPDFPLFFNKQVSCVTGPFDPIWIPHIAPDMVDYEGELAFVIGRRCRYVPAARATEVIAGYMICNDVSVRDWQRRAATMTLGKSFDTHGPIGPWLVTPDEVGDPQNLNLRTLVNGAQRQNVNTREMVFSCFQQVETLSAAFTLMPGDIVSTGTPSGVGMAMKPPGFIKAGDVVRIEIEKIGYIENPVIAEPANIARI